MKGEDQIAGTVLAVNRSAKHTLQKPSEPEVMLLAGLGIEGDAHMGVTVKHRSRVARDPTKPNLRQVHFIHAELHEEIAAKGFKVLPGQMGENITTSGIEVLKLPKGTLMQLGDAAVVEITGLRSPCKQLNSIQAGLMEAVLDRDDEGNLIRKSGVFGIVIEGGIVRQGDRIVCTLPSGEQLPLEPV